jgi:hypothetical protein
VDTSASKRQLQRLPGAANQPIRLFDEFVIVQIGGLIHLQLRALA